MNSYAVSIYGNEISAAAGKTIMIPVQIKENDGLMGFRIKVKYDPSVLSNPAANSAKVTSSGLFNDNIANSQEGEFDVVWCSDSQTKENGELMLLSFTAAESAKGKTTVSFDYSSEDTFNEKWKNVPLELNPIIISFGAPASEKKTKKGENIINDKTLITIVDSVLDELGTEKITEIRQEDKEIIVERVNELISQSGADKKDEFRDFNELSEKVISAQKEVFIKDVNDTVDAKDISEVLNNSIQKSGYSDIKEIPEKKEFLNEVIEELQKINPDISLDTEVLPQNEVDNVIDEISHLAENDRSENKNRSLFLISVLFSTVVIVIIIIVILINKKRVKKNEKE